jgi:hypothetical protein
LWALVDFEGSNTGVRPRALQDTACSDIIAVTDGVFHVQ